MSIVTIMSIMHAVTLVGVPVLVVLANKLFGGSASTPANPASPTTPATPASPAQGGHPVALAAITALLQSLPPNHPLLKQILQEVATETLSPGSTQSEMQQLLDMLKNLPGNHPGVPAILSALQNLNVPATPPQAAPGAPVAVK